MEPQVLDQGLDVGHEEGFWGGGSSDSIDWRHGSEAGEEVLQHELESLYPRRENV